MSLDRGLAAEHLHGAPPVRVYTASIVKRNARLLARFWISDPSDGRLDVISDINELLLEEFRKNGIRFA